MDLEFGNNLSPIITSRFIDQGTGQVNRELLNSYKSAIENGQLDPQTRQFWAHQEKEIVQQRLSDKITNIATKGLYVPTWMAEMIGNDQNQKLDFAYVQVPFDNVANTEVSVSDADYAAYLKAHAGELETKEELRTLEYIVFDVVPTSADSAAIRTRLDSLMVTFARTDDDSTFVQDHYGSLEAAYLRDAQLPTTLKDTAASLAVGEVYGPYVENGFYRAAKIVDRMIIPDSVKSRHILIRANPGNQVEVNQAFRTIDSLKTLIEAGTHRFDSLAASFGQDGTAANGGDLGFVAEASEIQRQGQQGGMVKPFNDLIFFTAEPGKLYVVGTQFGVHLVEVTDRKYINNAQGTRLAFIGVPIEPSNETRQDVENDALDISESYTTLDGLEQLVAERTDLSLETSRGLARNDFQVTGLDGSQATRDMIRWAFGDDPNLGDPSVGEVSPELYSFQDQTFFF
ncbi:MAG: peptidylprolyl isomerase, partial [Phaeodactylibacter sp.]|nr:peptidylprolyl isomerase [Phaeodactylibacter sp.]